MEYPTVPITQDTWNDIFKRSKNISPIQKYIDIKSTKIKKRKTKRKTTPPTKKSSHTSKKTTKKSQRKNTKQKSKKKQRVFKAPVNFM